MAAPSRERVPYEKRRLAHIARAAELAGPLLRQIDWHPQRLRAHRREQLRRLLRHAKAHSPWHARRLAALDPDTVDEADLDEVPPMTKADLMANWDEIVTDPRLSLTRCEEHIQHLDSTGVPAYLENEFYVLASGGSSGRRGVFVFGWDEFAIFYLAYSRWALRGLPLLGRGTEVLGSVAAVTSSAPTHPAVACGRTFAPPCQPPCACPVLLPVAEIGAGL